MRLIRRAITFHYLALILAAVALIALSSRATAAPEKAGRSISSVPRKEILLDVDWRFHRGDLSATEAALAGYDDSQWRRVDVPHDYVLEGTYDRTNEPKHGYLPCPPAWYRKHFIVPASDQGKVLRLDFDGVFRDSQVWLNGQLLGRHPSGYTPFSFDVSNIAKPGEENVIVVRVDPSQFEGHWYEGGGIYRHVRLTVLPLVHVAQYGTFVASTVPNGDQGADDEADLAIQSTLENSQSHPANCEIISDVLGPEGHLLATVETNTTVPANGHVEIAQQTTIQKPALWDIQSPALYQLRTTILHEGAQVDSTITTFGIRTIRYDANSGFFLNGKHVEIQGVANHQDFAGVGIAVPDSLQPWRVEQLKKIGCNGWRTAHNMPSEALLDACDRQGMMVMEENRHLGDAYGSHSPPGTTATNLSDLATMILRDRNHPSVIMWSLCNEEGQRQKREGVRIFAAMKDVVHRYDTTRPLTCAINSSGLTNGISDEDLVGVNYRYRNYDDIHRACARLPMFGSEGINEKTTRGEYGDNHGGGMCSSYNLSDKQWLEVATRPFIAGMFVWTGFDYKGEPNPYNWPDVANHTGLMDSCGFPKDKYYYFESCWSPKPMVHLLPSSWNWPGKEGQNIRCIAFSNAKKVELFMNGHCLGIQDMPYDGHLEWQVPYQPGQLMAKAYSDGAVVATDMVQTTGAPSSIQLSAARTSLVTNAEDAVVVAVSILDAQGRVVPDANNRVTFQLAGSGTILGVGNGNPADHDPDKSDVRNAFHGHCMAIIEAGSQPGTIQLTAVSPGLASGSARLDVR